MRDIFPERRAGVGQNYLWEEYPGEIYPAFPAPHAAHTAQVGFAQAPITPPAPTTPAPTPTTNIPVFPPASGSTNPDGSSNGAATPVAVATPAAATTNGSQTGLFVAGLLALGIGIAGAVWLYHQNQSQ
jgi:hypothetical protein